MQAGGFEMSDPRQRKEQYAVLLKNLTDALNALMQHNMALESELQQTTLQLQHLRESNAQLSTNQK